jgi:cytochrome c peroxidase
LLLKLPGRHIWNGSRNLVNRYSHALVLLTLAAACGGSDAPPSDPDAELRAGLRGIKPLTPQPAQDPALVDLGRALFFDKILSGNRDVSCATCHLPGVVLGDGLSLSIGTGGTGAGPARTLGAGREFEPRNAPTLLNVGFLAESGEGAMFWDGRVRNFIGDFAGLITPAGAAMPPEVTDVLVAQAMLPVVNRAEMRGEPGDLDRFGNANELAAFGDTDFAGIWQAIMQRLLAIPEYVAKFNGAFPGTATNALGFRHAAAAIAAFERQSLNRIDSPFDRYLSGDNAALTTQQKRGGILFTGSARCIGCHDGSTLGGRTLAANNGAPQLGPGVGAAAPLDSGFGAFRFRPPPLRNVELTAPYMHDGAYATLEAVVRHYNDVVFAQQNFDVSQLAPMFRALHHGDATTIAAVSATLDNRLPASGTLADAGIVEDLVAFLKSLTDPAARDLSSLVPASVPSGLPVAD